MACYRERVVVRPWLMARSPNLWCTECGERINNNSVILLAAAPSPELIQGPGVLPNGGGKQVVKRDKNIGL